MRRVVDYLIYISQTIHFSQNALRGACAMRRLENANGGKITRFEEKTLGKDIQIYCSE